MRGRERKKFGRERKKKERETIKRGVSREREKRFSRRVCERLGFVLLLTVLRKMSERVYVCVVLVLFLWNSPSQRQTHLAPPPPMSYYKKPAGKSSSG